MLKYWQEKFLKGEKGVAPILLLVGVGIFIILSVIGIVGLTYLLLLLGKLMTGETSNRYPWGPTNQPPGTGVGVSSSVPWVGAERCKMTSEIMDSSTTYRLCHNSGKVSEESHLATTAEVFNCGAYPCNSKDQIERHYKITGMPSGYPKLPWTPAEGGGKIGQGTGRWGKPGPDQEPWIVNMLWNNYCKQPPPNLKILVCNPNNQRCIVAVGSFEKGPSASTGHIAGLQIEAMKYLGVKHGSKITIGYLVDQSVSGPYGGLGPVNCSQ